jgi:Glycosyltransferase family 87
LRKYHISGASAWLGLIALAAAASMWFYVGQISIAYQLRDAASHDRPRGNLSDLYPRWLGARELLLHHRNPYGDDVTSEIQEGYYGRVLDASRPNDPKDAQGFAYPVYVVFLLAPLIALPFDRVHGPFYWLLAVLAAGSVWFWLIGLRWRLRPPEIATSMLLVLGSFAAVQGLKLQQLTLLVAGLLAAAMACVVSGYLFFAGALLALATIKPQLTWLLAAWLLVWAISNWRERRNFIFGFGLVMLLLLAGSEIVLPGWWRMFAEALARYHHYTQNRSVLDQLLSSTVAGEMLSGIAVVACACLLWQVRGEIADTAEFGIATALVTALTVLVVPMTAPYNQVLLVPVVLVLVRDRRFFASRSPLLWLSYLVTAFALSWQWMASLGLTAAYLLGFRSLALNGWKWPFFSTFAIPVLTFALIFVEARSRVPLSSARAEEQP